MLANGKQFLFPIRHPRATHRVKSRKSLVSDRATWRTRTSHKTRRGERCMWIRSSRRCKKLLFLIRHPQCYSYNQVPQKSCQWQKKIKIHLKGKRYIAICLTWCIETVS